MIPQILHQMWFDKIDYDNETAPKKYPKYVEYTQKWRQLNPEMTYMFWNGRRIEELWKHPRLSKWKSFFHSLARHIEKCDYSRYAILYLYGGVYIDLDFIPLKPIKPLLQNRKFGWCYEPSAHQEPMDEGYSRISNGFLMSTKDHPIWPQLLDVIMLNYDPNGNVLLNTGPTRLSRFARTHKIPQHYFIDTCLIIPVDVNGNTTCENSLESAYCYTRWYEGTQWWNDNNKVFLQLSSSNIVFIVVILIILIIVGYIYLTNRV